MGSKSPASWKQKRSAPPAAAAGLKQRRTFATLGLLAAVAITVACIYWFTRHRFQETLILRAGKSTSENQFALPPNRYVENGWTRLSASLIAPNVHFEKIDDFVEDKLQQRIAESTGRLQSGDALIVWINGTGIVASAEPMLVGDLFRLPPDGRKLEKDHKSLIELAAILESMSEWQGPKLLLLDWGQEVFEPRIDLLGNNFVESLERLIKGFANRPSRAPTWVMISHMQGQISLVDSVNKQSLFGRAVNEALLNERVLPDGVSEDHRAALPPKANFLSLASLAEYVHRRVSADSQGFQTPWLLKSGEGIVPADGQRWSGAGQVRLMALDAKSGRPLGLPAAKAAAPGAKNPPASSATAATSTKADSTTSANSDSSSGPKGATEVARAAQPKEAGDLQLLWQAIDQWRTPQAVLDGWSEAALSPLAFKDITAQALDLDLRAYAGLDCLDEISALLDDLQRYKRTATPQSMELDPSVEATEAEKYRNQYLALRNQRQIAFSQLEALRLFAALRVLKTSSLGTDSNAVEAMANSFRTRASDATSRQGNEMDRLIQQVQSPAANRGDAAAYAEVMLRSSGLSAAQRMALRDFQFQLTLRDLENRSWLDQSLKTPKLLAVQQSWRDGNFENLAATRQSQQPIEIDFISQVDPRDLHLTQDRRTLLASIERGLEFPLFPTRPEPPSQWHIRWDSTATDTIRLEVDKASPLALVIAQTGGKVLNFPEIRLNPRNVSLVVNEKLYEVNQSVELDRAWFKPEKGGFRLAFEVIRPAGSDAEKSGSLTLESSARTIKQKPVALAFDLPVSEPIELLWGQRIVENGVPKWRMTQATSKFTLTPFPGRESKFQFAVKNIDTRTHEVEVRLHVLPESDRDTAFGQVALVPDLLNRQPEFVWKEKISAEEFRAAKLATPKAAEAAAAPAAGQPPAAPPAAPPADAAADSLSISGGGVLQLLVDDRPPKEYWVNFRPIAAQRYIDAKVRYETNQRLTIDARWLDINFDGLADLAPDDIAKKPLVISWDPLPWRSGNDNILAGKKPLPEKATWISIQSPDLKFDKPELEVWLDIDDTPRSLIYSLRRDGRGEVTRPSEIKRSRSLWRKFTVEEGGKKGLAYVPFVPPPSEKDSKELRAYGAAVFPDLKGIVELQLAIDLPSSDDRFSLLLGQIPHLSNARDRKVTANLRCVDDEVVVRWTEEDLRVPFDFSNDQLSHDRAFPITISSSSDRQPVSLPAIVADIDGPSLIGNPYLTKEVLPLGSDASVSLSVKAKDASSVILATVLAKKAGKPAKPVSGEPLLLRNGENANIPIDASGLEVGDHTIQLRLEDEYKHASTYPLSKPLRITPPVAGSDGTAGQPAVEGDLKVLATLMGTNRKVRNDVEFKIEPEAAAVQRLGPSEMLYKKLKAGSYKVTANYSEASAKYTGTKTIVIAKNEDFLKVWEVVIAKPD